MESAERVCRIIIDRQLSYFQQQLSESQHPSLQQLLLHSPVSQPSLQQPSAQQVYLQHVSTVSICSIIIVPLFLVNTIIAHIYG